MKESVMLVADPKVHESTKIKAPCYSFGGKTKDLSSTVSPAPNSYNTSGLTSKVDQEMVNAMISERIRFLILLVLVLICKKNLQGKDEPTASSLHIRTKELKK